MKQKSKEKYYYSETEDQIIVNSINDDFKRRQLERKPYELTWELNMNFYMGNQYSYISNTGNISDIEKRYSWENREVFNHIAPVIETRLSKLNKVKPAFLVRPASNSDEDLYSAKLATSVLQNCTEKNSLNSLVSMATAWSEITGTSFYKLSWDDNLGNVIGQLNGAELKNGDVTISVCSPFEIYPDSNGAIEIDDCSSIIEARPFPVEIINSAWGINLAGENVDIFELNNTSFLSGMSGRSNITKVAHSTKHDHVLLLERYEKPSINKPNGRLTIICKNKLLYDGDLPYILGKNNERSYPFIKQVSTKQISCFWGISVIERCIPIQRSYNAIKNKKHEFIERLASGVLSVEDGSVDIDNLEDEGLAPGKILVYRNGSTPPKFLDPGSIPAELEKEEDKLLAEINNLSCISDVTTNSSIPSGINSGSALNLLIEQDETRLSLTAEYIRESIKKIGEFIIKFYKQYAQGPRLEKLTDKNGSLEIFYWKNSDLTSDDVVLDTKNELIDDESDKKQLILKLLDKGLLNDEDGQITPNNKIKLFNMLGFENWEISENIDDLQKKRANKENHKLIELMSPIEIDNHQIHICEHTKFLISDASNDIDNDFRIKLLNHIKQHKNFLKEE
jgi:hypothetical protein